MSTKGVVGSGPTTARGVRVYDRDSPIANLGPLALRDLLTSGAASAHEHVRHLNLSELTELADAADLLGRLARFYVNRICGKCMAPITWYPNAPTGQAAGWRHVDQAASYRFGAHRAEPASGPVERAARPCCESHNQHCEPPSELCCHQCTEARHPVHPAGVQCTWVTGQPVAERPGPEHGIKGDESKAATYWNPAAEEFVSACLCGKEFAGGRAGDSLERLLIHLERVGAEAGES